MPHTFVKGEAVPAPPTASPEQTAPPDPINDAALRVTLGVELGALSVHQGHLAATQTGRVALAAMALAVIVRVAARMPAQTAERRALARAARELREVV